MEKRMIARTEEENLNNRLKIILDVGRAFNSVIDINQLLNLIADRTAEFLNAERCSIYVVDFHKKSLWT